MRPRLRPALALGAGLLLVSACTPSDVSPDVDGMLVRVPSDVATLAEAADRVDEGGMILLAPGTYTEQILIETADVTVRGEDRNETIIDGEGVRGFGVVGVADGIRVENLTSRNHLYYGVLVTGVYTDDGPVGRGVDAYAPFDPEEFPPLQRFAVDHVTASNNGLYGIYAFNAQHGTITASYASGSADSGLYVGQCEDCDILVEGNVAERNAVGFENANASGAVVTGNRFSHNRVGMTFLSNYLEAFSPQRENLVAGNVVADNAEADSPSHAEGSFGIGIGISGGQGNDFRDNVISGHPTAGVLFDATEDLAAQRNQVRGNRFAGNAVDVGNVSSERAPAIGNCLEGSASLAPAGFLATCDGVDEAPQAAVARADLLTPAPAGMSFLKVALPESQPGLDDPRAQPRRVPDTVDLPDPSTIEVPDAGLLADLTADAE